MIGFAANDRSGRNSYQRFALFVNTVVRNAVWIALFNLSLLTVPAVYTYGFVSSAVETDDFTGRCRCKIRS